MRTSTLKVLDALVKKEKEEEEEEEEKKKRQKKMPLGHLGPQPVELEL